MRKLEMFMMLAMIAGFTACTNLNTPEAIAEKFNKALYKADFEGAKALCTTESRQAVDFVAAFASEKVDAMKKADIKYETTEVKVSEDGNSAVVKGKVMGALDLKSGEISDSTSTKIHLVKQQEKWLVEFKLK